MNWSTAPVHQAAQKLSELQLPGGVKITAPEGSFNFSVANWLASRTDTGIPVGEKVAAAAKEGGFLGFGGTRVSEQERSALQDLTSTLQGKT